MNIVMMFEVLEVLVNELVIFDSFGLYLDVFCVLIESGYIKFIFIQVVVILVVIVGCDVMGVV